MNSYYKRSRLNLPCSSPFLENSRIVSIRLSSTQTPRVQVESGPLIHCNPVQQLALSQPDSSEFKHFESTKEFKNIFNSVNIDCG